MVSLQCVDVRESNEEEMCYIFLDISNWWTKVSYFNIKSKLLEDLTLHLYLSLNILSQNEHLIFLIFK